MVENSTLVATQSLQVKIKYPAKPDTADKNLHKQVGAAQRFHAPNFRLKPGGLQSAAGEWAPEK